MKTALSTAQELCVVLQRLARAHGLGAVALVGKYATAIASDDAPVEVFVSVDLSTVGNFGEALARETDSRVIVYDVRRVPWAHPLHLCAKWVNAAVLPIIEYPEGSVLQVRHENGSEGTVRLDAVPHLRPTTRPSDTPRGAFCRHFAEPPIGGFLL